MTRMTRTSTTTATMIAEPLELFGTVDGPVAAGDGPVAVGDGPVAGGVVVEGTTNKH